ncbi:MAG: hypothetical protein KGK30_01870 [Elusimicrobia bacterium]|nr:hypothetical protein [Elusimicrobiota bacterium]
MKRLIAVALMGACAAASAQPSDWTGGTGRELAKLGDGTGRQIAEHQLRQKALEVALEGMGDSAGVGDQIATYLKEHDVAVGFAEQSELSKTSNGTITLSWKLPASPQAIGLRVAWEASAMMLSDMPVCAERAYMRRSLTARAFAEIGGDLQSLLDPQSASGVRDEELAGQLKMWFGAPYSSPLDPFATRFKSLLVLREEARGNQALIKACQRAEARFLQFRKDELIWLATYPR